MKIIILYILIGVSHSSVYSQKQLDSIYSYQFKNEAWEATTRRTYVYGPNFRSEYWSSYDKALGKYRPTNYNRELYLSICDKQIEEKEFYGTTNDAILKTSAILWERDTECNVVRRTHRLASGDTTELAVFSDFDNYGSPLKELNYLRGQNGQLTLFRDYSYDYFYNAAGNITSQITSIVTDDIIRSSTKVEYTYINGTEIESVVFFIYEPASATWRKTQEFQYTYNTDVEITKLIIHNTGTPVNTQIDSFYIDSDGDYIKSITYSLVGGKYVNSFRNTYFYKSQTSSIDNKSEIALDIKIFSLSEESLSFQIRNINSKNITVKIIDIGGKIYFQRKYDSTTSVVDNIPNQLGLKIFTIYDNSKLIFSKLIGF